MIRTLTVGMLMLSASSALSQSPPPTFTKVVSGSPDTKKITFEVTLCKPVSEIVQETVQINGKQETRTKTVTKIVCEVVQKEISFENAIGYDADGQKLSSEQLWQRIKPGTVIITAQSQLPEAPYLKVLAKETLVVVTPFVPPPQPTLPRGASPLPPQVPVPTTKPRM